MTDIEATVFYPLDAIDRHYSSTRVLLKVLPRLGEKIMLFQKLFLIIDVVHNIEINSIELYAANNGID